MNIDNLGNNIVNNLNINNNNNYLNDDNNMDDFFPPSVTVDPFYCAAAFGAFSCALHFAGRYGMGNAYIQDNKARDQLKPYGLQHSLAMYLTLVQGTASLFVSMILYMAADWPSSAKHGLPRQQTAFCAGLYYGICSVQALLAWWLGSVFYADAMFYRIISTGVLAFWLSDAAHSGGTLIEKGVEEDVVSIYFLVFFGASIMMLKCASSHATENWASSNKKKSKSED